MRHDSTLYPADHHNQELIHQHPTGPWKNKRKIVLQLLLHTFLRHLKLSDPSSSVIEAEPLMILSALLCLPNGNLLTERLCSKLALCASFRLVTTAGGYQADEKTIYKWILVMQLAISDDVQRSRIEKKRESKTIFDESCEPTITSR